MTPSGATTYTYSSGSNVVSPLTNTSYSVTGTSALGCIGVSTAVSNVTVNTTPTITVNSGVICTGQSFTMSPSGAILGAGVWTSSAAKVGLGLLVIVGFWTEGLCK